MQYIQNIPHIHLLENNIKMMFHVGQHKMPTSTEINTLVLKFVMDAMAPLTEVILKNKVVVLKLADFKTKYTVLAITVCLWHKAWFLND